MAKRPESNGARLDGRISRHTQKNFGPVVQTLSFVGAKTIQSKPLMKSIWVFLLGAAVNLAFLAIICQSYLEAKGNNLAPTDMAPFIPYALWVAGFVIAGALARYYERPGLGNVLVMIVPALGVLTALFFIFLIFVPKGLEIKHILGFLLAVLLVVAAFYLKAGSYKRMFDAAKAQAARQQERQASALGRVTFKNTGRSGLATYRGEASSFDLYYEFGGNDMVIVIDVPSLGEWLAKTGLPPEQREQVLHEIGAEAVKAQAPNGRYALEGDSIVVHSR